MHSLQHCDQTNLSTDDLESDSLKSKKIFDKAGFGPNRGFAYPYGRYNQATQDQIGKDYAYARSSDAGYNDYYFDMTKIKAMSMEQDTTLEDIKRWINYTKKHNLWLVLTYHKVDEEGAYNTSSSDFEMHLKAIKDSGIKPYTINQALQKKTTRLAIAERQNCVKVLTNPNDKDLQARQSSLLE